MTKRIRLTISYKNGNTISGLVNYVHVEDGKLIYTVDSQIQNVIEPQIHVPLENIDSFDVEPVFCDGWSVVNE